jgi:hypothetical protein
LIDLRGVFSYITVGPTKGILDEGGYNFIIVEESINIVHNSWANESETVVSIEYQLFSF